MSSTLENVDDLPGNQVVDSSSSSDKTTTKTNSDIETTNGNNKNWLRKATSNVIQQVKSKKGAGGGGGGGGPVGIKYSSTNELNDDDDNIIVPTPITSMIDDTQTAQDQKLWGMSTTTNNESTTTTTISSYNSNSKQSQAPTLTYDNFSFSPPPNFIPISSCDDLIEPPVGLFRDFNDKNKHSGAGGGGAELKISSNFSKLIKNSKRVDQVRNANVAAAAAKRKGGITPSNMNQNNGNEEIIITSSKEADEYLQKHHASHSSTSTSIQDNNQTTVHKAQQNLIEQLKKSLDYITNQNKLLSTQSDTLTKEISKQKVEFTNQLQEKSREVEERNIKLAALEQHFMALNNPPRSTNSASTTAPTDSSTKAQVGSNGICSKGGGDASSTAIDETKNSNSNNDASNNKSDPTAQLSPRSSISSSIVQIDKSYLKDLEHTVKLQKQALEKFESENKALSTKVTIYTSELDKKERTIANLESSLKQGREARFKNKKSTKEGKGVGHRRKSTSSLIISTTATPKSQPSATDATSGTTSGNNSTVTGGGQSDDEFSISATSASNTNDFEKDDDNNVKEEAINNAVKEALAKQESDHQSSMDVLNQQLDIKDKIIQRHEMKLYSLLKKNDMDEGNNAASLYRQRQIPQDVMIRNISVTNELMDASIRKLEKMMEQLEIIEKEKQIDLADEISPIRRVATKVSLVHEEMKVAIKLIEQKVANNVENIRQQQQQQKQQSSEEEETNDYLNGDENGKKEESEEGKSGQTSGEGGDNISSSSSSSSRPSKSSEKNFDDQIAQVLTESIKALKGTEASMKSQIDDLTEQLHKIEFELSGKQDTIEALELACSEHVQNCRTMQEEIEQLKLGMMQV